MATTVSKVFGSFKTDGVMIPVNTPTALVTAGGSEQIDCNVTVTNFGGSTIIYIMMVKNGDTPNNVRHGIAYLSGGSSFIGNRFQINGIHLGPGDSIQAFTADNSSNFSVGITGYSTT